MDQQPEDRKLTEQGVRDELQRQPHLLMMLAENALICPPFAIDEHTPK